jgi:hypothetical protein
LTVALTQEYGGIAPELFWPYSLAARAQIKSRPLLSLFIKTETKIYLEVAADTEVLLYTDVAETLFRTRFRAWPTTKIQAIACDKYEEARPCTDEI